MSAPDAFANQHLDSTLIRTNISAVPSLLHQVGDIEPCMYAENASPRARGAFSIAPPPEMVGVSSKASETPAACQSISASSLR